MATRGRKPKTTNERINEIRRKESSASESPMLDGKPTVPQHLDITERAAWFSVVSVLDELGSLSRSDANAIEVYASTYGRYKAACDDIKLNGMVQRASSGYESQRPSVGIANTCAKILTSMLDSFGLTPSSRARVHARREADDPTDTLASFLALRNAK